jgi:hypothetical protein
MTKIKIKINHCPILETEEFFKEIKRGLLDNEHELNINSESSISSYDKLRNDFFVIDSFENYSIWLDKEGYEVYKSCPFGTSNGSRRYKGKLSFSEKIYLISLCNFNQKGFSDNNIGDAAQESLDIYINS